MRRMWMGHDNDGGYAWGRVTGYSSKRPYGNSDIVGDIKEICGLKGRANQIEKEAKKLHYEMATAIEICLCTQTFHAGDYEADFCMRDWKLIKK